MHGADGYPKAVALVVGLNETLKLWRQQAEETLAAWLGPTTGPRDEMSDDQIQALAQLEQLRKDAEAAEDGYRKEVAKLADPTPREAVEVALLYEQILEKARDWLRVETKRVRAYAAGLQAFAILGGGQEEA
jgi:hypothetical protein